MSDSDRAIKIVGAICFALIAAVLIILNNSPATGYEASIYTATPIIVWAGMILSFICGLGIILHQLYTKRHEESELWLIGLLLIAVSFLIVFSVHIFRGYLHLGGDVTTHLAHVQNIISSGHFESQNIYAVLHVYLTQLSQITRIDTMVLILYVPVLFYVGYMLSMYLLTRTILPEKGHAILATAAGVILPLHFIYLHATPMAMVNMLIPFTFILCIKHMSRYYLRKTQFVLLLLLMIFLLPMFHPHIAATILLMLLTITLSSKGYNMLNRKKHPIDNEYRFPMLICAILFIWTISWINELRIWDATIYKIWSSITTGGSLTGIASIKTDIAFASSFGYPIVQQFFKVYATPLLYAILTLISIPVLLYKLPSNSKLRSLLAWCGPLGIYVVALATTFGSDTGLFLGRMSKYILMISAMFVGYISYEILEKARLVSSRNLWHKFNLCLLVVAMIGSFVNVVFTSYGSRYTLAPNDQITRSELRGMSWFISNKTLEVSSLFLSTQGYRLKYLFFTRQEAMHREDIPGWPPFPQPPYHFNYDKQNTLGEAYNEDNYMVLNKEDRLLYTEVWPEIAEYRFYPQDFEKLEQDPSVDKLYASNGLDIWYIHSNAGPSER